MLGTARSAATVEGILAAVVEFVRFATGRGWCDQAVADRLSFRVDLRFAPSSWDRGERSRRPVVNRRVVRRRRPQRPPAMLTVQQADALVDACGSWRDRFVVEALYATGLRVAELCGLHLADLHLVPSATHLGCQVAGAHLHVIRRENNENGALAKSVWPRVVPVTTALVLATTPIASNVTRWPRPPRATTCSSTSTDRRVGVRSRRTASSGSSCGCRHASGSEPGPTCCATASLPRWRFDQGPGAREGAARARFGGLDRRLPTRAVGRHARRCGRANAGGVRPNEPGVHIGERRAARCARSEPTGASSGCKSLMGESWLEGEWDPDRHLILPRPGGRLTRVLRSAVASCPSDCHGTAPLCLRHRRQFESSKTSDLDSWLASGEPAVFERRHCVDRPCVVSGPEGERCPRPAQGRWSLCPTHTVAWAHRRAKGGIAFESFLAHAVPLSDLGPCVVACCCLAMTHPESGLCEPHFQLWRAAGRPRARLSPGGRPGPSAREQPGAEPPGPARAGAPGAPLRHRLPGGGTSERRHGRDAAVGGPAAHDWGQLSLRVRPWPAGRRRRPPPRALRPL